MTRRRHAPQPAPAATSARVATLAAALAAAGLAAADTLCLVRPDGGGLRPIADVAGRGYGSPDWSPDGRRIACDTWPLPGGTAVAEIGVLDVDPAAGVAGPLTLHGHGAMPSWSPDGSQLVCHTYATNNPSGNDEIVVVNADGSGREAVLEQWGSPRWAPDGRCVVTTYRRGLAAYDLATGVQTILLGREGVDLGFGISPDGTRYAFGLVGAGGLGVAEPDPVEGGLRVRRRVGPPREFRHTSWSPDGRRLVTMTRLGEEPWRLATLAADADADADVDANGPPEPIPGIPPEWECYDPDWSPDGEWIVFCTRPPEPRDDAAASSAGGGLP